MGEAEGGESIRGKTEDAEPDTDVTRKEYMTAILILVVGGVMVWGGIGNLIGYYGKSMTFSEFDVTMNSTMTDYLYQCIVTRDKCTNMSNQHLCMNSVTRRDGLNCTCFIEGCMR